MHRAGIDVLIETYWNVNTFTICIYRFNYIVLIETYWNVNYYTDTRLGHKVYSLNRNILECKFSSTYKQYLGYTVLIETYWNVNLNKLLDRLIDEYSLNRNILECKFERGTPSF